jgi:amidase
MEMLVLLGGIFLADGGKSVRKFLEPTGERFRPEMKPYEEANEISVCNLWQMHVNCNTLCKSYLD